MENTNFCKFKVIISGCLTVLILLLLLRLRPWMRAVRLAFKLHGPPAIPLFGNVHMMRDGTKFVQMESGLIEKYGVIFRTWLSILPFFVVLDPKHIKEILGNAKVSDKNFVYSFMRTFLGAGLTTNAGAILGIGIDKAELIKKSPFTKGQLNFTQRLLKPWLLLDFIYKLTDLGKQEFNQLLSLKQFSAQILDERKRDKEFQKTSQWCFLDVLLEISENNPEFTRALQEILDEVCTFMLAGQDSVGASTALVFYYLAKYPEIQEKVLQELNCIFQNSPIMDMESLNEMKYLESMRLSPTIPIIARKLLVDVDVGEWVLPAGCNIMIIPYVTHRMPEYFSNPEEFNPDRFADNQDLNAFSYIPFSAGPRNCIGNKFAMLEMKTIISTVLRNYKIYLPTADYEAKIYYRVTLRAKGGIVVRLEER